jgi:hypothetical protein
MGTERPEITISYKISRHNSSTDLHDEALAGKLLAELWAVCTKPEYRAIEVDTSGMDPQRYASEAAFYDRMRGVLADYVAPEDLADAIYAVYRSGLG